MIVAGLTGSIGMGKSTTAAMFRELRVPVFDADAVVASLYAPGGTAARRVSLMFPDVLDSHGGIDRTALRKRVTRDADAFARLEAAVHPLVASERRAFLRRQARRGARVIILDIPLLFETNSQDSVDAVIVVSAPAEVQRARVLSRPGMTPTAFKAILARQVSDSRKRASADFVIDTSRGLTHARREVKRVLSDLKRRARMRRKR